MRPDFSEITLNKTATQKAATSGNEEVWNTPEGIPVKNHFTEEDIKDAEHLNFAAGVPPFLRGPYSTMDYSSVCRIFYCRGIKCFL